MAAKTVKYVFSLALNGLTYTTIAKRLNEEKITKPSVYLAEHGGRKNYKASPYWSYESVRTLLTNRIYTGDTESYKSHILISAEDFEKARKVVKVTKTKSSSKGKLPIIISSV